MDKVLVTGAAGFIGSNAAARFAREGVSLTAVDNLTREGAEKNAKWLAEEFGVKVERIDIRNGEEIERRIRETSPDGVLHLAAQTAVTTSVENPRVDCGTNVVGTLNILEAIRRHAPDAHVIFSSTNKVYGELDSVSVVENETRYRYEDLANGVSENHPLDFRTPYGVSKGAADQYVIDWARTYDLKTTALRQSCIYGPRQVGIEDQGWVAWFVRAALAERPITIYGDGKQVRDLLHVDDLLDLFEAILADPNAASGEAFNVGGGGEFTLSLLEFLDLLEDELGRPVEVEFGDWREGDQRVFYCDTRKARCSLGWAPCIAPQEGVCDLIRWIESTPWLGNEL